MSATDAALNSIVIRLVDHGERNRIVTLLTAESGRIAAIARGARGKSRRFGGHLDLFHMGEASIRRRQQSGLGTLQRFDVRESFEGLRQDIVKFAVASFLVELVALTTTEETAEPAQYDVVLETLESLVSRESAESRQLLLRFQIQWFYLLGILPELTPEGLVDAHLKPMSSHALEVGERLFQGAPCGELEAPILRELGALTRALRYRVLNRPLASEPFLARVLRDT